MAAGEADPLDGQAGNDRQIPAMPDRVEKRRRRTLPFAVLDVLNIVADTFLVFAVQILAARKTHLFACLDHPLGQRIAEFNGLDMQRPANTPIAVIAKRVILDGAERLAHCRPAPVWPGGRFPGVVILLLATHIDHAVDRRGAAKAASPQPGLRMPRQAWR